jgi:hypothetical protein
MRRAMAHGAAARFETESWRSEHDHEACGEDAHRVRACGVRAGVCSAAPAEAKQCVWNKAGFVRVDWFKPGTVTWTSLADGSTEISFAEQPVQTDSIWSASGRCINRGPTQYEAVLSVCGGMRSALVTGYPAEWPESNRIDCSIWLRTTPSSTRYLDVWGPVWEPKSGDAARSRSDFH